MDMMMHGQVQSKAMEQPLGVMDRNRAALLCSELSIFTVRPVGKTVQKTNFLTRSHTAMIPNLCTKKLKKHAGTPNMYRVQYTLFSAPCGSHVIPGRFSKMRGGGRRRSI
jgi:hypothetical protein